MYSVIQCLYNLPNVDLGVSVEVLPPKSKRHVAGGNALPRFVNLACGVAVAAQHNSCKLLSLVAIPRVLVRLIQADKSFKTLWAPARSPARLAVSELLFLRGQLGLDLISGSRTLREAKCFSLFCATTSHPETHNLSASTRSGHACAFARQARACPYTLAQFLNSAEASLAVKSCSLSKLWNTPGFTPAAGRLLACGTNVECGVCTHGFARCLALAACSHAAVARAMFVCALAKLHLMVSNNIRWPHVFVLNKFRTLRKLVWLLSFPVPV
ncbi:5,10-methylenetetrahydrofolate reductase [Candidatus Hodgkinia cicadicola]|nr:5,10-methylenetetrahydrofolate reductase [Candidatus Hodgkinia cicadicola]